MAPWSSPYVSMANTPIIANDPKGDFIPIVVGGVVVLSEAAVAWITGGTIASIAIVANRETIAANAASNWNLVMSMFEPLPDDMPKITLPGDYPTFTDIGTPDNRLPDGPNKPTRWNPFGQNGCQNCSKVLKIIMGAVAGKIAYDQTYGWVNEVEGNGGMQLGLGAAIKGGVYINLDKTLIDANQEDPQTLDVTVEYSVNYVIEKGDNLTKIAEQFNTTVDDIMEMNPQITDKNKINEGDSVVVGKGIETKSVQKQ